MLNPHSSALCNFLKLKHNRDKPGSYHIHLYPCIHWSIYQYIICIMHAYTQWHLLVLTSSSLKCKCLSPSLHLCNSVIVDMCIFQSLFFTTGETCHQIDLSVTNWNEVITFLFPRLFLFSSKWNSVVLWLSVDFSCL